MLIANINFGCFSMADEERLLKNIENGIYAHQRVCAENIKFVQNILWVVRRDQTPVTKQTYWDKTQNDKNCGTSDSRSGEVLWPRPSPPPIHIPPSKASKTSSPPKPKSPPPKPNSPPPKPSSPTPEPSSPRPQPESPPSKLRSPPSNVSSPQTPMFDLTCTSPYVEDCCAWDASGRDAGRYPRCPHSTPPC